MIRFAICVFLNKEQQQKRKKKDEWKQKLCFFIFFYNSKETRKKEKLWFKMSGKWKENKKYKNVNTHATKHRQWWTKVFCLNLENFYIIYKSYFGKKVREKIIITYQKNPKNSKQ